MQAEPLPKKGSGSKTRDITWQQFGLWTVMGFAGSGLTSHGKCALWHCRCECGTRRTLNTNVLQSGKSKSCGCTRPVKKEKVIKQKSINSKTRKTPQSPEYSIWRTMNHRVLNPLCDSYPRYGGRGITICERWKYSFENFLADMGPRPSPNHSIDRKNNNGNYDPKNCRWATLSVQANNKRTNRVIAFGGESMTAIQWSERTGIPYKVIIYRLNCGWSEDRTLNEPTRSEKALARLAATPTSK